MKVKNLFKKNLVTKWNDYIHYYPVYMNLYSDNNNNDEYSLHHIFKIDGGYGFIIYKIYLVFI